MVGLVCYRQERYFAFVINEKNINESIFNLLFLMCLRKVSLLSSQQFEMQVKVKRRPQGNRGNLFLVFMKLKNSYK